MSATRHEIAGRSRTAEFTPVLPADFELAPGAPVEPESLLRDPRASLYAIELDASAAYLVVARKPIEPNREVFYYQAQFREAEAVVRVPIEAFHRIAREIDVPRQRLVF